MGKLEGKVAVITGGSSGLALASAKRFVEEGAYVFITGRRQEQLDEAVKLIGRNVTGVRGDAANLDDLDRLFDMVKREKGKIDVLFASAGKGEAAKLGEITEQHFDAAFGLIFLFQAPRGCGFEPVQTESGYVHCSKDVGYRIQFSLQVLDEWTKF